MPNPHPLISSLRRLPRHIATSQQRRSRVSPSPRMSSSSSSTPHKKQSSLPASYYRGGTSRALFFKQQDLPTNRADWSRPFLGAIGSPDPHHGRQLDGLGGGVSSLSKVCVVGSPCSPPRDDADVDYTFAAVGVRDASVDYSSNCGNMSAAVGPFAVDCGMVDVQTDGEEGVREGDGEEGVREVTVRIHNTNTGKIIHATFPVSGGEALAHGDFAIDGVAGTAAPIRLDFIRPAGSRTGRLLPTGNTTDTFEWVRTTCIDVANPCCFVLAADLGVRGDISPAQMEGDAGLMGRLERIRREVGVAMGLAGTEGEVPGSVPKIAIVSRPPPDADLGSDKGVSASVVARALSVGQPHKAIPVTVALALAAAAKLPGSVVAECVSGGGGEPGGEAGGLVIHHASGKLHVDAEYDAAGELERATVFRTARRLMEGRVFWK